MQASDTTAFDVWLHDTLATTFNAALHEPVPDDLLEIVTSTSESA